MPPSATESLFGAVGEAHAALRRALDGMDYCLDWRPQPGEWSAREVVSHLLSQGRALNQAALQAPHGDPGTVEFPKSGPRLTPERREQDLPELLAELDRFAAETASLLADLLKQRPQLAERVAAEYQGHWQEHIRQLSQTRLSLGL